MQAFHSLQEEARKIVQNTESFTKMSIDIRDYIFGLNITEFLGCLEEIGIIPENIPHDSSEEKFYAKVSDTILSRAFYELGLKTHVLTERGDAADVTATSIYHNYSLVGDAKVFRLSRTAKNQKDFKVSGLDTWRRDNDYAILCSPLYQYPKNRSQVYKEALNLNVSLFSWEYLIFLIKNNIKESKTINLAPIWNFSKEQAKATSVANCKNNFLQTQTDFIINETNKFQSNSNISFNKILNSQSHNIQARADIEEEYWKNEIQKIKNLSREEAIEQLLDAKKIDKKIQQIHKVVKGAKDYFSN